MGLIPVAIGARWARLRAGYFGWLGLLTMFAAGGACGLVAGRIAYARRPRLERTNRPRAGARMPPRLDYALRWLKTWPERAPTGKRRGLLTAKDFPLAEGLLSRFEGLTSDPAIAVQLAVQEAADGSDREQQIYDTRAFASLAAAPAQSVARVGELIDRQPDTRELGQLLRLVLALAQYDRSGLGALYRQTFTRPVRAGEPGSEAALLALYGYLSVEPDGGAQRAAVRDALAAHAGDDALQAAIRRVVFLRSEQLLP